MTMQGFGGCKYYRWLCLISHCLPTMFLLMEFIDDEEGVKLFFMSKAGGGERERRQLMA